MSIFVTVVAVVLVALYTALLSANGMAALPNYLDIPSLLILLLLVIPVLISAGMLKDFFVSFKRAFSAQITCTRVELQRSMEAVKLARKSNYTAGVFGFLLAFVHVCKCYDRVQPYVFWVNMAVAIIPLIYAAAFDLVFLAVYGRLKKRYMDFMQMGYEMSEKEPETTAVVTASYGVAEGKQQADEEGEKEQA